VLIDVTPGWADAIEPSHPIPLDFDEMRAADAWFVDQLIALKTSAAHAVRMVTRTAGADRLEDALHDVGIKAVRTGAGTREVFGRQLADRFEETDGCTRTWFVERFPGTELDAGWLYRLLPPGIRVTLSWHAVPLPTGWIVDYLQRQLVAMRATRMQRDSASADPVLAGALPAAESLQQRLTASQEKAFHVSLYITARCRTLAELDVAGGHLLAGAAAMLCRLEPCTFRMLDGHLATLPLGLDRLARRRVLDTTSLTTFFPWRDVEVADVDGLVVGRSAASGCPIVIDPYDHSRYANANIAVFGHSGAGKTYLLSTLAMGALGRGVQVCVIDPEHEYGRLAELLGGIDVQLALGSGHALNVLDLRPSGRHDDRRGGALRRHLRRPRRTRARADRRRSACGVPGARAAAASRRRAIGAAKLARRVGPAEVVRGQPRPDVQRAHEHRPRGADHRVRDEGAA
jgi:hypothetical protein